MRFVLEKRVLKYAECEFLFLCLRNRIGKYRHILLELYVKCGYAKNKLRNNYLLVVSAVMLPMHSPAARGVFQLSKSSYLTWTLITFTCR